MKNFIHFFIIFFCLPVIASDDEVIELHETKTLDQMVLDQNNDESNIEYKEDLEEEINNTNNNSEDSTVVSSAIELKKNIWENSDPKIVNNILQNAKNINSKLLQNEFNEFLLNLNLDNTLENNKIIFDLVIKYFYNIGDISKAYSLIKDSNLIIDKNFSFYNNIEINYYLSTFKLENLCNYTNQFDDSESKNIFINKIDIFCLVLEDKILEADLLNSILIETEKVKDENFQKLLNLLLNEENKNLNNPYEFSENINEDLIFLYSAMARIAEIPLNEKFLQIDSKNLSIPIILNKSSPIDLRIKAANQSFLNEIISVDSLAALYQSVDFDSNQLNNFEETINDLKDQTDILMAYYFQLINIQIFPSERLQALLNFWQFAKKNNLEEIAYPLSKNIVDSIQMSSDNINYSSEIAKSYIFNKDFEKALSWIEFYESTVGIDENISLVRIFYNLYSSNDFSSVINIIISNFDLFSDSSSRINQELIYVLLDTLEDKYEFELSESFDNFYDNRLMPSIFITKNIEDAIDKQNDGKFLIYSMISLNNQNWIDIHPKHLQLILEGFTKYKNQELLKDIILEIFNDYNIL